MLTIITATPGGGKTCAMVSFIMNELAGRPLYADGIDGLTLEHVPVDVREWHEVVPKGIGAVVCVDEGQRRWRPRGPGQKVPPAIEALETHRHDGLDFFITTQHPKLLDGNVKNLCGRHIHIRDLGILGRWWYEWPEAAEPSAWRSAPIKKRYRLDRAAFSKYKSASLHVKPLRSFPRVLLVFLAAMVALVVLGFMSYRSIQKRLTRDESGGAQAASMSVGPGPAMSAGRAAGGGLRMPAYLTDRKAFNPRFTGQPESAPAYDEIRRVVVFPQVVGGYCRGDECHCITQQGTDAGLTWGDCQGWLKSPAFNPYRVPVDDRAQPTDSVERARGRREG
ncbi:MAG TPA: zonular occludens toxin domain-containing protein [Burkholderiales bacterium]|nr:zonular occludens toxin domain-containing protein [Burkholderiales bacterium]